MNRAAMLLSVMLAIGLSTGLTEGLTNPAIAHETARAHTETSTTAAPATPLFRNLGNYSHPISTQNPLTQQYFDQGLMLAYGFNHAEAARFFEEGAKNDPECAMCYWGIAYVLGPNINVPMDANAVPPAWEALQRAIALSENASAKEQAMIRALATRYSIDPNADRAALNHAYAEAMRNLYHQYPDDAEIATLFAEALMDTTPWDYWEENGELKPVGREITQVLESVLERYPDHAGANHLYIHAVEKERPDLGVASADRLMELVPDSGHLVHMASHIYIRVGRYHDAVVANQYGVEADNQYAAQYNAEGVYPLAYMPHNHHFLWFGAMMTGQSELAIEAARQTAKVDPQLMRNSDLAGSLQHYYTIPMFTAVRFSQWNEILAMPRPDQDLKYPTGVWHYARGMALLANGRTYAATRELRELQAIAADPDVQAMKIWGSNSNADVLNIAREVLAGKIAAQQGNFDRAIAHMQTAVSIEDSLVYTEPADWYNPTRQMLADTLLQAGRAVEAEQAYRADLEIYPDNGWSLRGLAQSLSVQGKSDEAQLVWARFEDAWQYADVTTTASR